VADELIGFVVADGLFRVAVSDGSAGFVVAEGVALLPAAEAVGELLPGGCVKDSVGEGSSVITTSLVSSEIAGSIVAVRVRLVTICSADIFSGVFVLVNVALEANGVRVEVPPASLFTIFVFELQAADNPARRTNIKSIKDKCLRIIRCSAILFAMI